MRLRNESPRLRTTLPVTKTKAQRTLIIMKHITSFIGTSTVALLILASPALFGQDSAAAGKKAQGSSDAKATGAAVAGKTADVAGKPADQDVIRAQKPAYPLKTCIVSNEELGKDGPPIEYVVNGRLVRLCCNDCKKDVDKDTAGTLKKLDLAVVSAQKSTYPLTTCPVTSVLSRRFAREVWVCEYEGLIGRSAGSSRGFDRRSSPRRRVWDCGC